jgi:uncharacterized protein YggE
MTLRISVRGSAERTFPADFAAVPVRITVEGSRRDEAYARATAQQAELVAALEALAESGAARTWSSDQVSAHSWRERGRQRHVAQVSARAEVVDVEALERFVDDWLSRDGVSIDHLHWDLTADHRRRHEADVRREAVADAVAKASDYAAALGFGAPAPVHVADEGMREPAPYPQARTMAFAKGGEAAEAGSEVSLVPQEIVVHVTIEAEFAAEA